MTDIEQKALALVNEVQAEEGYTIPSLRFKRRNDPFSEALCRAIEQHEAFRQEVSDMLQVMGFKPGDGRIVGKYIIAKPDPLVEALDEALWEVSNVKLTDRELRAVSLRLNAKRGGEIVWGEG